MFCKLNHIKITGTWQQDEHYVNLNRQKATINTKSLSNKSIFPDATHTVKETFNQRTKVTLNHT